MASSLVMGGVPAVVAMSGPVSDLAAVAFSRTFYQRLAAGDDLEGAVTEGRPIGAGCTKICARAPGCPWTKLAAYS